MSHSTVSIQELVTMATANDANARLSDKSLPAVAVPKDHALHEIEHLQLHRDRFRAKFSTANVAAFSSYYKEANVDSSATQTFIDASMMAATSVFNLWTKEGEPGHGDNKSMLKLERTAAFEALLKVNEARLSQQELAEWLEDWRELLTATAEGETAMPIAAVISAVRKITIEAKADSESNVQSFSANRSAMESIQINSQNRPPERLIFTCVPYKDLSARPFAMRLAVNIKDKAVTLKLSIIQLELQREEMAEEFKTLITSALPEQSQIYIGSLTI